MTTRFYTDERRWADSDPAMHCNGPAPFTNSDWHDDFIQALKRRDYDTAERIRKEHVISDECAAKNCEYCPIPETCACPHHSIKQFPLEHPPLRSLTEAHRRSSYE